MPINLPQKAARAPASVDDEVKKRKDAIMSTLKESGLNFMNLPEETQAALNQQIYQGTSDAEHKDALNKKTNQGMSYAEHKAAMEEGEAAAIASEKEFKADMEAYGKRRSKLSVVKKVGKNVAKKLPVVSALVGLADYLSGNKDALADAVMPLSPSTMGDAERGHTGRKPDSEGNRPLNRKEQAASLIYELLEQEDEQSAIQEYIKKKGVAPSDDSKMMMFRRGQQLESNKLQMSAIMNETGMTADEVIDLMERKSTKLRLIDMHDKGDLEGLLWEEQRRRKPESDDFNKGSGPSLLGREVPT